VNEQQKKLLQILSRIVPRRDAEADAAAHGSVLKLRKRRQREGELDGRQRNRGPRIPARLPLLSELSDVDGLDRLDVSAGIRRVQSEDPGAGWGVVLNDKDGVPEVTLQGPPPLGRVQSRDKPSIEYRLRARSPK